MNVIEDIKRKKQLDEKISLVREKAEKVENRARKTYELKECSHDIVIKFYGTMKSFNEEKPLYICLGCHEDLTKKADDIEKDPTKKTIDFTGEYWYDVSKKDKEFNHYALIDYLRNLAIEESSKIPDYTDADFAQMVNDNVSYIMKNNNFKQCG